MAPATSQAGVFSGLNPVDFNPSNPVVLFIIQAAIILIFCRLLAIPLKWLRQPRVIAEVLAGIILGPSVMGRIPGFKDTIFPDESLPFINLIATLGLIFFLFQVGLEVDVRVVRRDWRESVAISFAGMALPFGLGIAVSVGLYKLQDDPSVSFSSFMLFLGVAMSITAFPVLARILAELKLLRTRVGALTMASGLLNDCTAWVLLALVVALMNSTGGILALYVFLTTVGFALFLIFLVRPLYYRLCVMTGSFEEGPTPLLMTVTLLMVLMSAFVTDIIGVHPIFGGFLAGVIIPHERDLATKITEKIEDIVNIIFLPLYFTLSGLKTQIGLLNSGTVWGYVILVIFVACFGKIMGCTAAAKLSRMTWRESLAVGFLMNCKGLVELIVLNIGHDAGVLNDQVFVIMVVMALVTTFMTTPVVMWLYPEWYQKQRAEEFGRDGMSMKVSTIPKESSMMMVDDKTDRYCLVTMLNRLETVPSMMALIKLLKLSDIEPKPSVSETTLKGWQHIIEIHALRLHELTQRSSDVMKTRDQRETLRRDPVLNVLGTFANLIGIDLLQTSLDFVLPSEYVKMVANRCEQVGGDMILLPWTSNRFLAETNLDDEGPLAVSPYPYTLSDAEFANQAFSITCSTVGLFVDRGFGLAQDTSPNVVRILVPFMGGPDDRAALLFALRLQLYQPAAELCVLRFNTTTPDKCYASPANIEATLFNKDAPPVDDTTLLNMLFTLPSTEATPVSCEPIDGGQLTLDEAMQTILNKGTALAKNDLVVIGRKTVFGGALPTGPMTPSIESPGAMYSKEFKAALGPVAFGLLSSAMLASLVVIQAPGQVEP